MARALIVLRKLRLWKMGFRIYVRVLQVAVANGHTAVERELRKFLKVRNSKCSTRVGYLHNGSEISSMYEVSIFGSHIPTKNFEGYSQGDGVGSVPRCRRLVLKWTEYTLHIFDICFNILTVYICQLWISWNIALRVSNRQCYPFINYFPLLLFFLTAHGRNSLSRPRNSDVLQPASEKKRKKTQNRSDTVQLFKAGILDLNGKLARSTPTWRVQRK